MEKKNSSEVLLGGEFWLEPLMQYIFKDRKGHDWG